MFPIAPYTVNYVFVENALGVSARVAVNYNVPNAAKVSVVPDWSIANQSKIWFFIWLS